MSQQVLLLGLRPCLCSLLLFLLLVMNKADGVSLMNSSSSSCNSEFDCGNGIIIRYPFWRVNKMTSSAFCGYPGFGISCFEAGRPPILRLPADSFYVRSINYSSHTFTLVDADLFDVHASCPTPTYNISLSYLPNVSYTSWDRNLTLFFNCNSYPMYDGHANFSPISCFSTKPNMSFALTEEEFLKLQQGSDWNWDLHCEYSLVLPLSWSAYNTDLSVGYARVIQSGFELKWGRARNCADCEDSGGRCGHNDIPVEKEFLCFCSDGVREGSSTTCHTIPGHHLHLGLKLLIIAFSSLAGGIIMGCGAFFICKRCRCRSGGFFNASKGRTVSSPSSTPISGKMTSNPTLTDLENGSANFKFGVQLFTYEELEEATNNFNFDKELGCGGFGTVYHGKLRDAREVAIKRLNENNYKRVEQFKNEVRILTHLRHHNLVTLYGCTSRHCRELLLVYEFIPNGTVADHLHGDRKIESGSLNWPTRMTIAIETAIALSYLHASDIIHRDVKTNNILLDNKFRVKVADFGLSRLFPTDVTHVSTAPQGTPGYVDPEYQQCYQLTEKSDVYSFGVVLVELISSKPAVDITRHRHEINLSNLAINKIQSQALHELVDPCLGFDSDYIIKRMMTAVAELAFRCLQLEKEMRPTMDEVLEYLKQIEKEDYSVKPEVAQEADTTGLL